MFLADLILNFIMYYSIVFSQNYQGLKWTSLLKIHPRLVHQSNIVQKKSQKNQLQSSRKNSVLRKESISGGQIFISYAVKVAPEQ